MKISIRNFKSIGSLVDYELKPLTILSGTNSSGKSSFIQLLLLLKQTLYLDSSRYPLYIDGKLYSAESYLDLIRNKNASNKVEIGFAIEKKEFEKYGNYVEKSIFDNFADYLCLLNITYSVYRKELYIEKFELIYNTTQGRNNYIKFLQSKGPKSDIVVDTNNEYFIRTVYPETAFTYNEINFSSIFPSAIELVFYDIIENPKSKKTKLVSKRKASEYPNLNSIKSLLRCYFNELYYVGPLRTEPQDSYANTRQLDSVGVEGEYTAQVLEQRKKEKVHAYLPFFIKDEIEFTLSKTSLLEAVNHWICKIFKFGKKIHTRKKGDSYSIYLVNQYDVETTIKHVGFGISQVLPIIVQGLLLKSGATLILEQPEIHLHPKVQSLLFDFLQSLILQGKNVIIETHSDHFITRMRRRIAEDEFSNLKDKINLTFIEQGAHDLLFRTIDLDDFGTLNYFPKDFIERPDIELNAIIKAQMKKRTLKKKKS